MTNLKELYFKNHEEWRVWLHENHIISKGVYLVFFKVNSPEDSMRWEEAVKVALCYGWIDSTVKNVGGDKRIQYFCPRKEKSVWSKLNKTYIKHLINDGLLHESGYKSIEIAKTNGSWTALDDVENLIIPTDLQEAFHQNKNAYNNYKDFSKTYQKSYLYWLNQAKRDDTRSKRIQEIIQLCQQNIKSR